MGNGMEDGIGISDMAIWDGNTGKYDCVFSFFPFF